MQSSENSPATELSTGDREAIVRHLDACVAVLDEYAGHRTLTEIRIRSMVAVLRDEIAKSASIDAILPPLGFNPSQDRKVSLSPL